MMLANLRAALGSLRCTVSSFAEEVQRNVLVIVLNGRSIDASMKQVHPLIYGRTGNGCG